MTRLILAAFAALAFTAAGQAQTTGTVFGPETSAGDREVEYRIAAGVEESGSDASLAHRLHYQQAINDSLRWRAIISWTDPAGGDFELDHVQGELLWQIIERTPGGFSSGLRFDARLSEGDDVPHEIGVNLTNQWVAGDWRVRALVLFDRDVGPQSNDDWILETRASLYRSLDNGLSLGLESFNEFGGLDEGFGGFDDQSHQLGPVVSGDLAFGVEWSAGVLFGLSFAGVIGTVYHLGGALIVVTSVICMGEVLRAGRYFNVLLGLVVAGVPWLLSGASTTALVVGLVAGLCVAALALPRGPIREQYGSWDRPIR